MIDSGFGTIGNLVTLVVQRCAIGCNLVYYNLVVSGILGIGDVCAGEGIERIDVSCALVPILDTLRGGGCVVCLQTYIIPVA